MRLLILSQYFAPEITAAATRFGAFATELAARGHEVEVICEVPSHPSGVVAPGYRGRLVRRRSMDGYRVSYVWVRATPSKRPPARIVNYASYAAMAAIVAALRPRPDAVLATSPPLPVGAAAALAAARHRVPWVLDVRDLWPAAAVSIGQLRDPRAIRLAEWLERRLYASARAITATTEALREHVAALCGDPSKVHLLPNGTSPEMLELGAEEVERGEAGLPSGRFVWTYAGNIGLLQGVDAAVEAAGLLGEGFQLLLAGDGPLRVQLERRAAELPEGSVVFTGAVPRERAGRIMRASDALLVSLADDPGVVYAVPSKLYDCCALGRPVIVAARGESQRLADRRGIALTAPPGDPAALASAVRRLRDEGGLRESLATAAREFAAENLRERQAERLEELLESLA